jgi:hypothetical protein
MYPGHIARINPLLLTSRVRTDDRTMASPTPWPLSHDIPTCELFKSFLHFLFNFLLGKCLLLGPPWQGPAVHIPPPTSVTAALCLITTCAGKVSRFPSHLEGDRSSVAHRDQRKPAQYGGNWNNIQDLSCFAALVDDGWLAGIHPSWKQSYLNMQNMQNIIFMYNMQNM